APSPAAEAQGRGEGILVGAVIADRDRPAALERRPPHEARERRALVDPARLEIEGLARRQQREPRRERAGGLHEKAMQRLGPVLGLPIMHTEAQPLVLEQ